MKSIQDTSPKVWSTPKSLSPNPQENPYPIDALPIDVRSAVTEVLHFTRAPTPLAASSALAAISLAVQSLVDVMRAENLSGPVSLFFLTIADSGERKSTCDGFFMRAIYAYERDQIEAAKPLVKKYLSDKDSWQAKRNGLVAAIRDGAKSGKSTQVQESKLTELERSKPKRPNVPKLIYSDATTEALRWQLATAWPAAGIVSSEAGLVFGGHSMNKESIMRNLATLNQLWDGSDIQTERRSSESYTVQNARLSVALQVQKPTLNSFLDRSGNLARGTGFLARFLLASPPSTQGRRLFREPPEDWPALQRFEQRLVEILNLPTSLGSSGGVDTKVVSFDKAAKAEWISLHDRIERQLVSGGELRTVSDVASKAAENAARMAALFHVFEYGIEGSINLDTMHRAAKIVEWHLQEALRILGGKATSPELQDAQALEEWLTARCKSLNCRELSKREVQRYVSPVRLRKKDVLSEALRELENAERVQLMYDGKTPMLVINPYLLGPDTLREPDEKTSQMVQCDAR